MSSTTDDQPNASAPESSSSIQNPVGPSANSTNDKNGVASGTLQEESSFIQISSSKSARASSPSTQAHAKSSTGTSPFQHQDPHLTLTPVRASNGSPVSIDLSLTPSTGPMPNNKQKTNASSQSPRSVTTSIILPKEWSSKDRAKNAYGVVTPAPIWTISINHRMLMQLIFLQLFYQKFSYVLYFS